MLNVKCISFKHVKFIVLIFVFFQSCDKPVEINYEQIPTEVSKRFAAKKNCDCVVYSYAVGYNYKPSILRNVSGQLLNERIITKDNNNYIPQSISFDCNLVSMTVENKELKKIDIYVYNRKKKELKKITKDLPKSNSSSAFSPVENKLAYLSNKELRIYDYKSDSVRSIKSPDSIKFGSITWSSNGTYILLEDSNSNIWKYENKQTSFELLWKTEFPFQSIRFITPSEADDDVFYFISDHESQFNQIYKYNRGKVTQLINSNFDKYLLQRPVSNGYLYYRSVENGQYLLKRFKNGNSETILNHGVAYDYFADFNNTGIGTFADIHQSASLFKIRKGFTENLLSFNKPDTIPDAIYVKNKAGMFNLIYKPKGSQKGWVVFLHGGPKQQTSNRYNVYLASMVKAGFGVIALNYKGSVGLGNDYELKSVPSNNIVHEQILSVREDMLQLIKLYKISSYAIVAESYATQIARPYVLSFENEVSHYIELCGAESSNIKFKIPVMYIYGEFDDMMKNTERVKMIKKQLGNSNSSELRLKNEAHIIIDRKNIYQTVLGVNEFLNR